MKFSITLHHQIKLYGRCWAPSEPKLVIGLIHGLGEHIERYGHLADFLNQHQIALVGTDHEGHGQSEGKQGHASTISELMEEVDLVRQWMTQQFPDVPQMLYGHSLGGNVLLNYLLRKQPTDLKGAIATGPWIQLPQPPPKPVEFIMRQLAKFSPKMTISNGLVVNYISRDAEVVNRYKNDPHVHPKVSTSTVVNLFDSAAFVDNYSGNAPCPMLLTHGESDKITSPKGTMELSKRLQGDVTLKLWDGLYHEIHNEPEQDLVFQYILEWIEARVD